MIALAGVVVYLGWLSLPWPLIHDAPIMHYIAWRIAEGAVPYRDVFDMNFPGVYLIHLAVVRWLGAGDVAWRLFDLAWLAVTSTVVGALASRWGRLAAVGGGLFVAAYHLGGGAWQAGQRDFFLCVFLLAGALGVVRWGERGERPALLLAGIALGAGVMVKPHAVLLALGLAGLIVARPASHGSRAGAALVFVGGLVVIPALIVSWLALAGALGPWREIVSGYLVPFYSRLGRSASWSVYRWTLWPAIAGALVVTIGHVLVCRRWTFRHAVVLTGVGYGLVHYAGQGKGWEYHLYPLAAFAGVLLFAEVAAALRARPVVAGVPLIATLAVLVALLGRTGVANADAHWIWDKEGLVRGLAYDLGQQVRPGDAVQVLDTTEGGVHALLRLGLVQPTRFLYDFHFFHDTEAPAIQALRSEFTRALERRPPRLIVLLRRGWPGGGEERVDGFPALARLLRDGYTIAVGRRDYVIYAQRDRT